jgi:hypothetical protein
MGKRILTAIILLVIFNCFASFSFAASAVDSIIVDSIQVNQGNQGLVKVTIYNEEELSGYNLVLHYDSPDILVDSVSFVGSRIGYLANKIVVIDTGAQLIIVAAYTVMEAFLQPGKGEFCRLYFKIPLGIPDQKIILDSATHPDAGGLYFVDKYAGEVMPMFKGGKIIVGNPHLPPVIAVTLDSINFAAVVGGISPASQVLRITNAGEGTLQWTASKKSSWLSLAPPYGTAPSNVQVGVSIYGMTEGIYYDTIVIAGIGATNSPVEIPVRLTLTPPPPTIKLSKTSFNFNAIASGSNPSNQILTITNTGPGVLNWNAQHNSSWLTIIPTNGVDSGDITLAVEIAGLPYGNYYDTIVVSDPNATNNPQKAAVRLTVASSLPVIASDPPLVFVLVDLRETDPTPDDETFEIINEGAGAMTFTLSEHSPRIVSLAPASGSAPQTITASFSIKSGVDGTDIYDTVMVSSPEAINSPFPLVFQFHYTSHPAELVLNTDSLVINYYECSQGTPAPLPPSFTIFNFGLDPADFELTHKATWLIPDKTSGPIEPAYISLEIAWKEMAVGTYFDTIVVSAINAINSPVILPIKVNILETPTAPEIELSKSSFLFYAQENKYYYEDYLSINNANPGCMEWALESMPSWVVAGSGVSNTEYPWVLQLVPFANGLTMGHYYDTGLVVSDGATNSPQEMALELIVWKFYGDVDYNGKINLLDISYILRYLYHSGAAPKPIIAVADCNCDGHIDLLDISAIIQYLYYTHNPLCGNPY